MKTFQSSCLITLGILIAFISILYILFIYASGLNHSKKGLIKNYERHADNIEQTRLYFKSILPNDTYVRIDFNKHGNISSFHVNSDSLNWQKWSKDLSAETVDSILTDLGWTHNHIFAIQRHLSKANGISISGRNHVDIGWRYSGMGKYSYLLLNSPLSDSLISAYNDGCYYIYYKENVVLSYGGGAFGPQCFPDRK